MEVIEDIFVFSSSKLNSGSSKALLSLTMIGVTMIGVSAKIGGRCYQFEFRLKKNVNIVQFARAWSTVPGNRDFEQNNAS